MKKVMLFALVTFMFMNSYNVQAQDAPYKHSVGGVVGFVNGFSYKGFILSKLAIQADAGFGIGFPYMSTKANANLMYQGYIKKGFYWFAGGGVSAGYSFGGVATYLYATSYSYALIGINAIGGAEYKFAKIPLTLQADIRPGVAFHLNRYDHAIGFDYNFLNVSARYTF